MNAPNRQAEVADLFARIPLPIVGKTETDEGRRANLFQIVRGLNVADAGQWGVLVKTEQGNKIPGDVIVWRDTLEHFDVILGSGGPSWKPWGPVTESRWHWQAVDSIGTEETPPPAGGAEPETIAKLGPDVRASLGRVEDRQKGLPVEGDPAIAADPHDAAVEQKLDTLIKAAPASSAAVVTAAQLAALVLQTAKDVRTRQDAQHLELVQRLDTILGLLKKPIPVVTTNTPVAAPAPAATSPASYSGTFTLRPDPPATP